MYRSSRTSPITSARSPTFATWSTRLEAGASCLGLGLSLCAPNLADACGGTFCDGATQMAVDQTGEDILFVRDAGELEVHIRIQYTGEAENFAWLIPLPDVPDVQIGSDNLFTAVSPATIPRWTRSLDWEDPCDAPGACGDPSGGPTLDLGGSDPPPKVVFEQTVGSFEVVALAAVDAASVLDFFDQNNYAYDETAAPLIQTYLDEGSLITAVKLTAEASVNEIHPLVFRFTSDEPCIPLRLTAVAAREDLGIRAYFLGQQRWAPSNFGHVVVNPLVYDWNARNFSDYVELLSLAVDEAGGHAFATEYAGSSSAVSSSTVLPADWSSAGLEVMDAHMVIDALIDKQLIVVNFDADVQINPQVLAALRDFLPVPMAWGADEFLFWTDHAAHPQLIDQINFDAAGFAARLDERLFDPAMHAADLLEAWPYLTRLHTTISPEEMTLDPTFHEVPDLPTVSEDRDAEGFVFAGRVALRFDIPLSGETDAERERVCFVPGEDWPSLGSVPVALRIEQLPSMGPPQVIVDNREAIALASATHYEDSACQLAEAGGGTGDTGDDGTGGLGTDPVVDSRSSCACSSATGSEAPLGFAVFVVLLGLLRSRRDPEARDGK